MPAPCYAEVAVLAAWFLLIAPFTAPPMSVLQSEPTLAAVASDSAWLRPRCLSVRCGDEEWRREAQPEIHWNPRAAHKPLPGTRNRLALSAPTARRYWHASYSNDWRIGTRYGVQVVRDTDTQFGIELGAGYRIAPLHDDGIASPGPVFRGGINLGRRFGERAQWSQRVQFETGNGERFVKQMLGLDVELASDWMLETDYVIRYDSRGASGSETSEAWMGIRREF